MKLAGRKLRAHRMTQVPPLSQGELGERFGLTAMSISRIERGLATPSLAFVQACERAGIAELGDWLVETSGADQADEAVDA